MKNPHKSPISSRLEEINQEIAGRSALVAVTKYSPLEDIEVAYNSGQRHFGENRLQDLQEKASHFSKFKDVCHWHFLGPLQSNKIKALLSIPHLWAIHSVSRIKELEILKEHEHLLNRPIKIFFQINTSGEEQKNGVCNLEELENLVHCYKKLEFKNIELHGLMTMGKIRSDNVLEDARKCFQELVYLRDKINPSLNLSMGMTSDYTIALELGSDYVRIGSKIFKG